MQAFYVSRVEGLMNRDANRQQMYCKNRVSAILCYLQEHQLATDMNSSESADESWLACNNPGTLLTILAFSFDMCAFAFLVTAYTDTIKEWLPRAIPNADAGRRLQLLPEIGVANKRTVRSETHQLIGELRKEYDEAENCDSRIHEMLHKLSIITDVLTGPLETTWAKLFEQLCAVRAMCGDAEFAASLSKLIHESYRKCPLIVREMHDGTFSEFVLKVDKFPCLVTPYQGEVWK